MEKQTVEQYYQQQVERTLNNYQLESEREKELLKTSLRSAIERKRIQLIYTWFRIKIAELSGEGEKMDHQVYRRQLQEFWLSLKRMQEELLMGNEEQFAQIYYNFSVFEATFSSLQLFYQYNQSIQKGELPKEEPNEIDQLAFVQQYQIFSYGMEQLTKTKPVQKKRLLKF